MRFTILGSGTSAGVPVIGCDCPVCQSTDPRDQRLRPSACLETIDSGGQHRVLLLDTSPDLRQQALRLNLMRCDGIFYTHHHVDHIFGLDEVRRFNVVMDEPINVYAEPESMIHIRRVFRHIFESHNNTNNSFVADLIPNRLTIGDPVVLFGLRITPLRFMHGRLPIVGFRIDHDVDESLNMNRPPWSENDDPLPMAYCTDVSSIPPETWPSLTGLRTLVLDALRPRHHPTHFNIDQAVEAAQQIQADRTFFIHMTHNLTHVEMERQLPDGISPSHDGLMLGGFPNEP